MMNAVSRNGKARRMGGQTKIPAECSKSFCSTATSSTFSLSDADSACSSQNSEVEVAALIAMITKAVVEKQMAESVEDASEASSKDDSSSGSKSVDVEAVAELIFETVQKATAGKDTQEIQAMVDRFSSLSVSPRRKSPKQLDVARTMGDVVSLPKFDEAEMNGFGEFSETEIDDMSVISSLTDGFGEHCKPRIEKKPLFAVCKQDKAQLPLSKSSVVRFGKMKTREYIQIIGDNPSSQEGPSLGIGWEYKELPAMSVDTFESHRVGRRYAFDLVLSRKEREQILIRLGYKTSEIAEATRLTNKVRNQRRQTTNTLGSQKMEEAMEIASQKVKNLFRRKRS